MKKTELRNKLNNIIKAKFDFVEDRMIFPDEYAELNNNFPYVTIIFNAWTPQGNALYGVQSVTIIGIANGDKDTLSEKVDQVEQKLIECLSSSEIKLQILEIDNNNLFKPFGLDAGLFLPYGGVRIQANISNVRAI